ncbi:hypothetical protein [Nocardioides sp. Iso805N]|uniref:hypothetical protein n=1 Tax=Nocardioides sp. Iso805N TaxID=1283287 RepID=UPI00036FAE5A|nr:hypothetical protein [Nocardioides sp. Iso805N]
MDLGVGGSFSVARDSGDRRAEPVRLDGAIHVSDPGVDTGSVGSVRLPQLGTRLRRVGPVLTAVHGRPLAGSASDQPSEWDGTTRPGAGVGRTVSFAGPAEHPRRGA